MTQKNRTLSLLRTLSSTAIRAGAEALRDKARGANVATAVSSAAAERFVRGLDELKGAAMKMGQMLSLVDESLLPANWKPVLAKLQSEATAKPFEDIEPVLQAALPGALARFSSFEKTAVHAASIGQVHRATLLDGTPVAVKIRYPGLEKGIHADLVTLKRMLRFANVLPAEGNYDAVFAEVEDMFRQEIDFEAEARHYRAYREHFAGRPGIVVPRVIDALSGPNVLVTEWIDGINIEKWIQAAGDGNEEGHPRHAIARQAMALLFEEMFVMKTLQTDPNPGNFLITPNGELALLDFGAARKLNEEMVEGYRELSRSCHEGTRPEILAVCERMGFLQPSDSDKARDAFLRMMLLATEPFEHHVYDFRGTDLVRRLRNEGMSFVREVGLRPPPPDAVFLNRRIVGTQMLLERLGGRFDARAVLEVHLACRAVAPS